MNMSKEVWKPISQNLYYYGVNQDYEVSNHGRIRNSKTNKIINPYMAQSGKKLKWTMHNSKNGYDATLQFLVDHTVYETFIGDCYDKEVKHKDGNNFNNMVDNLYIKI